MSTLFKAISECSRNVPDSGISLATLKLKWAGLTGSGGIVANSAGIVTPTRAQIAGILLYDAYYLPDVLTSNQRMQLRELADMAVANIILRQQGGGGASHEIRDIINSQIREMGY